jgi:hypothetical protein
VHPRDADATLASLLAQEQLDSAHPSPWRAWKVFKRFLTLPAECEDDTASFQCYVSPSANGDTILRCLFVRQFSEASGEFWEPYGGVALELQGLVQGRRTLADPELWSFDFPDPLAFEQAVEGLAEFQALCNGRVTDSEVFFADA